MARATLVFDWLLIVLIALTLELFIEIIITYTSRGEQKSENQSFILEAETSSLNSEIQTKRYVWTNWARYKSGKRQSRFCQYKGKNNKFKLLA